MTLASGWARCTVLSVTWRAKCSHCWKDRIRSSTPAMASTATRIYRINLSDRQRSSIAVPITDPAKAANTSGAASNASRYPANSRPASPATTAAWLREARQSGPRGAFISTSECLDLDPARTDYESGGQEFESLRARQLTYYFSTSFSFAFVPPLFSVCSWFANFVRGEFSQLMIACSASPFVRAR